MYIYYIIFIYSPISEHLDCFYILAIMNNASVNMGYLYLFKLMFLLSLEKYP